MRYPVLDDRGQHNDHDGQPTNSEIPSSVPRHAPGNVYDTDVDAIGHKNFEGGSFPAPQG